ncbi:hypothetical protein BCR35DRAFT_352982 [Leucosporidium creatinivorum]|uniref:F-box domain-containing protein n=1 Tax=Leucosporidium creatinivorum TaxID=106004 RepID=A0A1Y2F3K8_9BASI|nr:hypothetical protein BCR35DRAFT_352982 [Leucosporidium creatinivorum]
MAQSTLPSEIISEILKLVALNRVRGWRDNRSLYACCLVSKSFLPLARAELYRSLTFSTSGTRIKDDITSLTEKTLRRLLDYTSFRLRDTLLYRLELGVHVEEVRLMMSWLDGPRLGDQIGAQLLDELRGRCPHLRELCLSPPFSKSDQTDKALARYGSQLRVLEYEEGRTWTKEWFNTLCALPKLEKLYHVTYGTLPNEQVAPPPIQLTSFYGCDELDQNFVLHLLHNSHASLTSLNISSMSTDGKAWDLSPFVALQSLELLMGFAQAVDAGDERNKGVLFTIGTCPHLVTLRFTSWGDAPKVWELDDEIPFLHLLPSTLRTLDLGGVQVSNRHLLGPLADSTILPSLHTLVLGDSTQLGDMREDDEDEDSWISVRREKTVMHQIERACEARSILLEWEEWPEGERMAM